MRSVNSFADEHKKTKCPEAILRTAPSDFKAAKRAAPSGETKRPSFNPISCVTRVISSSSRKRTPASLCHFLLNWSKIAPDSTALVITWQLDSNPRVLMREHAEWENLILPMETALKRNAPGGARTHNLRLRRPSLYPIELRAQ